MLEVSTAPHSPGTLAPSVMTVDTKVLIDLQKSSSASAISDDQLLDRLLFGVFSKLVCMRYHCTLHQTLYAWLMRGVWYWCGLESLIIGSYIYHSDVIAGTHAMLLI